MLICYCFEYQDAEVSHHKLQLTFVILNRIMVIVPALKGSQCTGDIS